MYYVVYSQFLSQIVRIYGSDAYIYKPDDCSKHTINGWVPTLVPIKKLLEVNV